MPSPQRLSPDELTAALRLGGDAGRLKHVHEVGVPQFHLDDPPPAEQRALAGRHHAPSSLGMRIRL